MPTALTGLLDWLDIPKGTPVRTTATIHLFTMVIATAVFAAAFVAQISGYDDGQVETLGLVFGLVAEVLLVAGGYLGGTIVFVYGNRVLDRPETPVADALVPGRAEGARRAQSPSDADGARTYSPRRTEKIRPQADDRGQASA